jgi:hypothetical protein
MIQLTHQRDQDSGLRTQLRLEQRLLKPKDGNGLCGGQLSSETVVETRANGEYILDIINLIFPRIDTVITARYSSLYRHGY